jgi:trehalose 6-phosphate phosphatase
MHDSRPPPLASFADAAVFLDFDGTLVELADSPDAIEVPATLPALLIGLSERLRGRLAIVSGRAIAELDRHLHSLPCAVAGSHGAELRLPGSELRSAQPPAQLAVAGEAARAYAASDRRLFVEQKPAGVALHYRLAPEREEEVLAFAAALSRQTGFALLRGKMVAELRPVGSDKGEALRCLMAEPPFAGARPLFVGDDLTDEDAFAAADALGGAGILVGPPRASSARWRLPDVPNVLSWLEAGADG